MLVEQHESGPGFADILGGLGYFAGLFGIAAYLKSRRR
jgi:nickel transport protein